MASGPVAPPPAVSAYLMWLTLAVLIGVTLFDLLALAVRGPGASVSYALWFYCETNPKLYLLVGIALGHIFLPLVLPAGIVSPPPA